MSEFATLVSEALEGFDELSLDEQISEINAIQRYLHSISPFSSEPVGAVQWVKADKVEKNGYNPNVCATTEFKLLEHSIEQDGYTQPIVAWVDDLDHYEVVDGFHRSRVGKESKTIKARVHGYLPLVVINDTRTDKGDRMASTIRHNRARGKHRVDAMSDIVVELKRRNWSDEKIGRELGMDPDEILRLTQVAGLAEMFKDREFSEAWEASDGTETAPGPIVEEI